jgi:periplasmic copper chaperone A
MWRFILVAITAVGVLSGADASAHEIKVGDLVIVHPWAVATAARTDCVVSMTIENRGTVPDRLTAAASPVAERTELHEHRTEDGTAKSLPVLAIDLPPGDVVKLRPGGLHLVLIGLKERLVEYGSFVMILKFKRAGTVEVDVAVEEASAAEPGHQ